MAETQASQGPSKAHSTLRAHMRTLAALAVQLGFATLGQQEGDSL